MLIDALQAVERSSCPTCSGNALRVLTDPSPQSDAAWRVLTHASGCPLVEEETRIAVKRSLSN